MISAQQRIQSWNGETPGAIVERNLMSGKRTNETRLYWQGWFKYLSLLIEFVLKVKKDAEDRIQRLNKLLDNPDIDPSLEQQIQIKITDILEEKERINTALSVLNSELSEWNNLNPFSINKNVQRPQSREEQFNLTGFNDQAARSFLSEIYNTVYDNI